MVLLLPVSAHAAGSGDKTITNEKDGSVLVFIPAGEFWMGSPDGKWNRDEHPRHKVRLEGYYIGKFEVTNAQFARFVKDTGYVTDAEKKGSGYGFTDQYWRKWDMVKGLSWRHPMYPGDHIDDKMDYPVLQVSWGDAAAYAEWAGLRLPTEAEWELAARAGTGTTFWWGEGSHGKAIDDGYDDGYVFTSSVGSSEPNPYGIYDMTGNAWEWCSDLYGKDYYAGSPARNPKGPSTGTQRVIRGGTWGYGPGRIRPAGRLGSIPDNNFSFLGFRVARPE